jgi:hypothetical protein
LIKALPTLLIASHRDALGGTIIPWVGRIRSSWAIVVGW